MVRGTAYDPYGITGAGNTGRFQYTGQAAIPELGLLYYKARFYNAGLGRFMQTDPIGYEDDVNLYAYTRNDPLNATDPYGRFAFLIPLAIVAYRAYSAYDTISSTVENVQTLTSDTASTGDKAWAVADIASNVLGGKGGGKLSDGIREIVGRTDQARDAARKLPDSALVCRGGTCTAHRFETGRGVSIDESGRLQNVSVNSAPGKSVDELTATIENKQVGVSTVGDVRRAGGDVIPDGNSRNPDHCRMCGITPQQAEQLFTPTIRNPNR